MKTTFKIGSVKVSGEVANIINTHAVVNGENKFKTEIDKSPIRVELNDLEVCYEDFTSGDVVTIAKEVGTTVFGMVRDAAVMQAESNRERREARKQEEKEIQEMNRRRRQSQRDKHINRMGKLSAAIGSKLDF